MKKFLGMILFIALMFMSQCYAAQYNILVIPCNIFLVHKNYLVFPESAEIFATDIINYYNVHPQMSAPSVDSLKRMLNSESNYQLKKATKILVDNYQKNYTINFDTVQKLAYRFKAKQVLLIASNMDAQNYVLRRTFWDFLDFPGATVVDPAYRLSTQVTLIDANNKIILWQENYQKLISSRENRIIPEAFAPSAEQLEKVKKYSTKFLAPQIVQETQLAILHLSPYQDLNLRKDIVKPQAVSIDKIKIDSKRGAIRSGHYVKKETKICIKKQKENAKLLREKYVKAKAQRADLQAQKAESRAAKLAEKKKLKAEQAQIKAEKTRVKAEMKAQMKAQKAQMKQELNNYDINYKRQKEFSVQEILNKNEVPAQSNMFIQQNLKPVPYIRTVPALREDNFTINDY